MSSKVMGFVYILATARGYLVIVDLDRVFAPYHNIPSILVALPSSLLAVCSANNSSPGVP